MRTRTLLAGTAVLALAVCGAAQAQSNSARSGANVQVAGLFGDDEQAQQREQAQDAAIAQLNQQVNDLQDSVRHLTGQNEQLQHRIDEMNQRVQRMQKDFEYRLCTVAGQQLGASGEGGLPCGGQQGPADSPASIMGSGGEPAGGQAPVHLAPPPGVLGTLPAGDAPSGSPVRVAPQMASVDPHAQFNAAMDMLARAQYDQARSSFRAFADAYPKDPLASQAVYWVGDISFVQKDYPNAARAFAEELKKYPAGARGPESMLKLGQSLIAMNQKQEGCTALAALPSKYPTASVGVKGQAAAARKAANCR